MSTIVMKREPRGAAARLLSQACVGSKTVIGVAPIYQPFAKDYILLTYPPLLISL